MRFTRQLPASLVPTNDHAILCSLSLATVCGCFCRGAQQSRHGEQHPRAARLASAREACPTFVSEHRAASFPSDERSVPTRFLRSTAQLSFRISRALALTNLRWLPVQGVVSAPAHGFC